jgi:hypothetical protein
VHFRVPVALCIRFGSDYQVALAPYVTPDDHAKRQLLCHLIQVDVMPHLCGSVPGVPTFEGHEPWDARNGKLTLSMLSNPVQRSKGAWSGTLVAIARWRLDDGGAPVGLVFFVALRNEHGYDLAVWAAETGLWQPTNTNDPRRFCETEFSTNHGIYDDLFNTVWWHLAQGTTEALRAIVPRSNTASQRIVVVVPDDLQAAPVRPYNPSGCCGAKSKIKLNCLFMTGVCDVRVCSACLMRLDYCPNASCGKPITHAAHIGDWCSV